MTDKETTEHIMANKEKIKELEKQKRDLEEYLKKIDKKIIFLESQTNELENHSFDKNFETLQNLEREVKMKIKGVDGSIETYKKINDTLIEVESLKPLSESEIEAYKRINKAWADDVKRKYKQLKELTQHLNLDQGGEITQDQKEATYQKKETMDEDYKRKKSNKSSKMIYKYKLNEREYIAITTIRDMRKLIRIEKKVIDVLYPDCSEETIQEVINQRLRQEFKDKIREVRL